MSSNTVEEIKSRLGIVELIGSYLKLDKAGSNFKARCPFHNEKTPSFFISPDRDTYYCFGCGKKGDIFNFVQDFEGLDFLGALKVLADRAGVEIKYDKSQNNSQREKLLNLLEKTTTWYQNNLPKETDVIEYLKSRGLTGQTAKDWRIGYALPEWDSTYKHLKTLDFTDQEIEKAGLIKKGQKGSYYDRLRGRIIFPIFDSSGRVVAYTGRILKGKEDDAKYINSPETELFIKSKILYGFNFAKTAIRKNDFSILVEGQMDVLMSHQAGYQNTVATSGTALSDTQLDLLERLSKKIVIALDGDGAGFRASEKAWKMALQRGMDVKVAILPKDMDPADLIKEDPKKWVEVIKNSEHVIDYLVKKISENSFERRELMKKISEFLVPYIAEIPSSIEQSHFVNKIAVNFNINEDALWKEVNSKEIEEKDSSKLDNEPKKEEQIQNNTKQTIEKRLIGIISWQESKEKASIDLDKVKSTLKKIVGEEGYKNALKDISEELAFQTESYYEDSKSLENDVEELLENLQKEKLEEKRNGLKKELQEAEFNGDENKIDELLKEIQEITKKIQK